MTVKTGAATGTVSRLLNDVSNAVVLQRGASAKGIRVFYSSGGTYTSAGYLTITARFITNLSGTSTPQITINQQGTNDAVNQKMTATADPNTWQYFYFVNSDDGTANVDGLATITISNIFNAANTPIAGTPSDIDGGAFIIDTQAPRLMKIEQGTVTPFYY